MSKKNSGFTLVELSIVLVIIGLIVGGIVGGQALIESARTQSQIKQLGEFDTAYRAFELQFDALPGDFSEASEYWGDSAVSGNGDGRITQDGQAAHTVTNENIKFFEHLSRAKVIPGSYSNSWAIGAGYPANEINSGTGLVAIGALDGADGTVHQLNDGEAAVEYKLAIGMIVGSPGASGAAYDTGAGIMSPKSAKAIDKKLDDGVARTGKFLAHSAVSPTQGNCLAGVGTTYLLSNSAKACMAIYIVE